jgi:hypothetical protein
MPQQVISMVISFSPSEGSSTMAMKFLTWLLSICCSPTKTSVGDVCLCGGVSWDPDLCTDKSVIEEVS